jgi:hypothetical protein
VSTSQSAVPGNKQKGTKGKTVSGTNKTGFFVNRWNLLFEITNFKE